MRRSFTEYWTVTLVFFDMWNTLQCIRGSHVYANIRLRICIAVSIFEVLLLTRYLLTRFTKELFVRFANVLTKY